MIVRQTPSLPSFGFFLVAVVIPHGANGFTGVRSPSRFAPARVEKTALDMISLPSSYLDTHLRTPSPKILKKISLHGTKSMAIPLTRLSSAVPLSSPSSSQENSIMATLSKFVRSSQNLNKVSVWRMRATIFLASIVAFRPMLDRGLVQLWGYLQNSSGIWARMFRHDHWEWVLAVVAFAIWIHGFWICDKIIEKSGEKGIFHPLRKYHLQSQHETEQFYKRQRRNNNNNNEMNNKNGKDSPLQGNSHLDTISPSSIDMTQPKPPLSKLHKWHSGAWLFEVPMYIVPLFIWDRLIPRRAAKLALLPAPTTLKICSDVTCGLLLYDFIFFFFHYAFHKIPFMYKFFHKKHHTAKEVRACDQVRLSGVEEVVDVGISIMALRFLGAHAMSRTIYNLVITFLLTELHSGYAFPWSPQEVVPFGLATGSRGHHYHHRYGKKYYQKFFCTVDRLFGFVDKKTESEREVYAPVSS